MQGNRKIMIRTDVKTHLDVGKTRLIDRSIVFALTLMIILVFTLVAYMYVRNAYESLTARNLSMSSTNSKLQQEVLFTKSEINYLNRPGQIQELAKKELGMVNSTPQPDAIFVKKKK
jgi:cell division protein FtsB